ncbi:MAG TPA: SNF2-related protein [Nitrososphaera sp.]|jgi:hypothetical protein|nr:SNF2-related protein [Nitrososphaera sp.]
MNKKYIPQRKPDENQSKALKKMRGKKAFALLMAMRMRKSKVLVDDYGEMELAGEVKDLMVIAPGGVYRTWVDILRGDLSEDLKERILVHVWQSGSGVSLERDRKAFLKAYKDGPRALIMNVEALSRPGEAREFAKVFVKQNKNVVGIDESTRIKNKSKRTDFILANIKKHATYRRILSGLVAPRSPLDLFFQYDFLDSKILGWNSWYAFRAHVAYMKIEWFGGRSVQIIDKNEGNNGFKPEAIKELKKLTDPHSYRVEFRPKVPTTYSKWEVEMTPEQEKAYREMKEHATTMLANEKHVTATVVIAQIMKLHQILCGHVKDEENVEHFLPENKTPDLLEILEDYSGKAIIWFSYDTDLRKVEKVLKEEYGDGCLARFWGGNTKTRDAEEKLFKNDPKCRFMLATPDSGGMGRTWDMADLAIYYSSKDNLEHRDQSEQRTMGRDKTRGVDVIDMVCPGTVEIKILEALRNKINMASVINGDTWREWVM